VQKYVCHLFNSKVFFSGAVKLSTKLSFETKFSVLYLATTKLLTILNITFDCIDGQNLHVLIILVFYNVKLQKQPTTWGQFYQHYGSNAPVVILWRQWVPLSFTNKNLPNFTSTRS
jgi:hypothetical protein